MNEAIYNIDMSELQIKIKEKEKEYIEAFKTKKVFGEIKKILDQQRAFERELVRRKAVFV